MIQVSHTLQNALWEYDIQKLQYSDRIVIQRALMFGEKSDIETIISHIGKEQVIDVLKQSSSNIDAKSHNFWCKYFGISSISSYPPSLYEQLNTPTFRRSFR